MNLRGALTTLRVQVMPLVHSSVQLIILLCDTCELSGDACRDEGLECQCTVASTWTEALII